MAVPLDLLASINSDNAKAAWSSIFTFAWETCSPKIAPSKALAEVIRRDRTVGEVDLYLSTAAWDLWQEYEFSVSQTSSELVQWWESQQGGKAVLVLDALSLRECCWLLSEAQQRGFNVHQARPTGAELPGDTTQFAKALGFAQRSALTNNSAGGAHRLTGATTESTDMAWQDCAAQIGSEPSWVFWHHWPDVQVHKNSNPGKGLKILTSEVIEQLTKDDFWEFVKALTHGRRLLITADHGYAASGQFADVSDKTQVGHLKKTYSSGRWSNQADVEPGQFAPPLDLEITSHHGRHLYVNGRQKWKSPGGYPTLTHGGLSVLEVCVPFIELSL